MLTKEIDTYLAYWPIGLHEVRLQVGVKQVACQALDGVIDGKDMNTLAVLDICALRKKRAQRLSISCHDDYLVHRNHIS